MPLAFIPAAPFHSGPGRALPNATVQVRLRILKRRQYQPAGTHLHIVYATVDGPKVSKAARDTLETPEAPETGTVAAEFPSEAVSLLLLNAVTVLWGTQHAVIKLAVDNAHTAPSALNLSRFLLAALIFSPALPKLPSVSQITSGRLPAVWKVGLEQSLWMFLGYAFQSIGLLTTSAARSGFLLYLNVKFVPILARVLYGRRIKVAVWTSALMAFLGTALLSYDGSGPNSGDVWSIGAALASAMFILRMEDAARGEASAAALNAVSLAGVAALSGVWTVANLATGDTIGAGQTIVPKSLQDVGVVLYLGVVTTALSNFLQTIGQRRIGAERAAVIFALDPVYGAGFACWLVGERIGLQGVAGMGIICAAAAVSNWASWGEGD